MRARIVLLGVALLPAVGESAAPSLRAEVPDTAVSVGDRISVRIIASGGDDWLWGEPQVTTEPDGPWEVVQGPRSVVGSRPPAWEFKMAPMVLGETPLPAVTVSVRPPDGEALTIEMNDPPAVQVASVLPPDQPTDPAPLRDPLGVSGVPWEWLVPAALGALPFAVLAGLVWRSRRPTRSVAAAGVLPPFGELEALARTLASRVGREPAAGVCDQLAAGFRRYLERRSGEPALEMTSHELRRLGHDCRWPDPVQMALGRVMGVVDGVRYGRRTLAETELKSAIDAAVDAGRGLETHLTAPVVEEVA